MEKISIKTIVDKKEWEGFLIKHPESNFLQSWSWGEFHKALQKNIERTGFYIDGKLRGVMLSIVEEARRAKYLTIPGGPIIDWGNPELIDCAFKQMRDIAIDNNCVFVRIRPQLIADDFSKILFTKYKCINAPMHLHAELTTQLDIAKPEDELLSLMRKSTRYQIKKAYKEQIKVITSKDPELARQFYDSQIETARRQKFVPFSYQFLYEQFKMFFKENQALLYQTFFEDKLLAQAFIIFYGKEAVYHYGTSSDLAREYPGAYLIQWEAIKEAKKRGIERYNFWGVASADNMKHRFYNISIFKRGFGGIDVEYLHAQDLVINKSKYALNYMVEYLRKHFRKV
jgi:lipid II:glycine glycyltransferase (peptidoglycan interpeptide bridge formation enzyme)